MKKKRKPPLILTEKERELIEGIRNYQRSFPNGNPHFLYYLQQVFDELTDLP